MITSVFRKSTPLNYSLVAISILVFFSLYQNQEVSWTNSVFSILQKVILAVLILASVFITSFIAKRNGLSKDSTYTAYFYFIFLLFFPAVLNNIRLVVASFFILLALRRLVSLQTLKESKEKIFDASLWIFLATIFHFWCILFIILVFISIIFHVSRDYRNWVLPFVAFFTVGILFLLFSLIFEQNMLEFINSNIVTNTEIDYFTNNYQNIAFSIFLTISLFFLISMFASLSNRPLISHSSFKKIIASFFIAIVIFIISANKSNELLIFTFAPLAIMATADMELSQPKLRQEMVFYVLLACSLFAFFSQL